MQNKSRTAHPERFISSEIAESLRILVFLGVTGEYPVRPSDQLRVAVVRRWLPHRSRNTRNIRNVRNIRNIRLGWCAWCACYVCYASYVGGPRYRIHASHKELRLYPFAKVAPKRTVVGDTPYGRSLLLKPRALSCLPRRSPHGDSSIAINFVRICSVDSASASPNTLRKSAS